MLKKRRENREQVEIFSIEEFVPAEHLLRKIDSAVEFTHIYDIVEDLYCSDNGRPSIDPVVLFKMVLIQHTGLQVLNKKMHCLDPLILNDTINPTMHLPLQIYIFFLQVVL